MSSRMSLFLLALVMFLSSVVHTDLVHRYSFETNASNNNDDVYIDEIAVFAK